MQRLILSAAVALGLLGTGAKRADSGDPPGRANAGEAAPAAQGSGAAGKDLPKVNAHEPQPPVMGQYPKMQTLAWSKGSTRLISLGQFTTLAIWECGNGQLAMYRLDFMRHHAISLATSQRSSKVVLGTNAGTVELRDGFTLDSVREFKVAEAGGIYAVALSDDDQSFACRGKDNLVQVWSIAAGKPVHSFGQPGDKGDEIKSLAFSVDGARLAALVSNGQLRVWNIADEIQVAQSARVGGGYADSVRFSRDGQTVLVWQSGMVTVVDLKDPSPPRVVRAPASISPKPNAHAEANSEGPIFSNGRMFAGATALALDDERVATVAKDGTLAIWSIKTGQILKALPKPAFASQSEHPGFDIHSLCYSPDSTRIAATTRKGEVMVWLVPFP